MSVTKPYGTYTTTTTGAGTTNVFDLKNMSKGMILRVHLISAFFQNDANVANRYLYITWNDDQGHMIYRTAMRQSAIASQTSFWQWHVGSPGYGDIARLLAEEHRGIPHIDLQYNERLLIEQNGMQVGDTCTINVYVYKIPLKTFFTNMQGVINQ